MNKNLLITFDEYQDMPPNKVPYTYVIENKEQYLYYFGSKHSYDQSLPQFDELRTFFNEFVLKTKDKQRIVLVEGGNWPLGKDEEESITEYGEMGFITYLANKANIEKVCPEPPTRLLYTELEKKFSRDQIEYYYFARSCWQWARMNKTSGFESYIRGVLKQDEKDSGWEGYDFSFEHMKVIHKDIFGTEFDISDSQFFRKITDPTKTDTVMNKISRFEDEGFRDLYILGEVEKYWEQGKSIFVIYGSTHAVIQEPALRTLAE